LLLALAVLSFIHFREKAPAPLQLIRLQMTLPEYVNPNSLEISPDGSTLAFIAPGPEGKNIIWVRPLDSLESRALPGTEGGNSRLWWSPDSRWIAFWTGDKIKKIEASGGPPETVSSAAYGRGGSWSREGVMVVGGMAGIQKISTVDGSVSLVTALDSSREELDHIDPHFLRDGRHFVYLRNSLRKPETNGVYLGSVEAKPEQNMRRILAADALAGFVPSAESPGGHLLFKREGGLLAQSFDPERMELSGQATTLPLPVDSGSARYVALFSASTNGVLVDGRSNTAGIDSQLTWFDRNGKMIGQASVPGRYFELALSPDGSRVAVHRNDAGENAVWTIEFARRSAARLTLDPRGTGSGQAQWSPDGSEIVYLSRATGGLVRKPSSGAGDGQALPLPGRNSYAVDWSRDGRYLLYTIPTGRNRDLWVLPLDGKQKPFPYLTSNYAEAGGQFSPDSHWVAYSSDESGRDEIYVRPFPDPLAGKWLVSSGGGNQPRWRRDGRELFYVSADNKLMSLEVSADGAKFKPGIPKALFGASFKRDQRGFETTGHGWDVAPDGQRFLINTKLSEQSSAPVTVILNWQAALKR
jgi:Tol biopolymer transport system component